jgi:hypothetical protein
MPLSMSSRLGERTSLLSAYIRLPALKRRRSGFFSRSLFKKETARTTLTIAAPTTPTIRSSAKDSNGYTTMGRHSRIITCSPKLCSLSPSPLCTNGDGMRRNPFNEMFLTTSLPAFSNGSSGRCALANAVLAMSANGFPGSGKQKMTLLISR